VISHIAALSKNRVIGVNNDLPWKISEDLKFFKEKTLGKCIIMGRKTFDSLGKPLPKRKNIVVTRDENWFAPGVDVFPNIDSAIAHAKSLSSEYGDEIMIAGGGEIFKQTLAIADRLYLTLIDQEYPGDAFYPEWKDSFVLKEKTDREENGIKFSFCTYEKSSS